MLWPITSAIVTKNGAFELYNDYRASVAARPQLSSAGELFQRIRRKSLDADRHGNTKLAVQFGFEEACAKTLYNLSGQPAPFDADSPYWIIPNALAAARSFDIDESEIIKAVA